MNDLTDNQILLYESDDGETHVEVLREGETVWLTQAQMSELFKTDRSSIAKHIGNIYETGELERSSTCAKFAQVRQEGKRRVKRDIEYYNLDIIISVGYRVNSKRGTQFRIWATRTLREYIVKGFVVDDDRLARGGSNYFEELNERVRRIRTSEYNLYKKVRSVFATSIDHDNSSEDATTFYATVQNKFHYAIHGNTAAELITQRISSEKQNMGLTTWSGEIVTKKDAIVAKNYLTELEMKRLGLLVEQFLSFAELQAIEQRPMYMKDWVRKLDGFIRLNEKKVLTTAGTVSRKAMENTVRDELATYRERIMAEEALQAVEVDRMLDDAALEMLPPPPDELEDAGISQEQYMRMLGKTSEHQSDE
ncbi:MAG: virulence RhuM family protein, partial [Chloroflexota bacterium]